MTLRPMSQYHQENWPHRKTGLSAANTMLQVAGLQPFSTWAPMLQALCRGCDLHGFNNKCYDLPMLEAEFRRIGGAGGLPLQFQTEGEWQLECGVH